MVRQQGFWQICVFQERQLRKQPKSHCTVHTQPVHTRNEHAWLSVTHGLQEGMDLPKFVDSVRLGWLPPAQKEQPAQRLGRRRLSAPTASQYTTSLIERNPKLWFLRWRRSTRNPLVDGSPRWRPSVQFAPGSEKTTEVACCAKNGRWGRRQGFVLHVLCGPIENKKGCTLSRRE